MFFMHYYLLPGGTYDQDRVIQVLTSTRQDRVYMNIHFIQILSANVETVTSNKAQLSVTHFYPCRLWFCTMNTAKFRTHFCSHDREEESHKFRTVYKQQ
jgi:hypothetical protein